MPLFLLIASCRKDDLIQEPFDSQNPISTIQPRHTSSELDYFARALANSQSDPDVRGFIKSHAIRNAYDDNCAIYALIKEDQIGSDMFHEILYKNRDKAISGFDSDFFEEDVLELYPSISIYVYSGDDEEDVSYWDTTINTGTFALPDYFSSETDSIVVYYPGFMGLTTSKIHPFNEPSDPYLVVSENSILTTINLDDELMHNGDSIEYRLGMPPGMTTCEDFWEALHDGVDEGIEITANGITFLTLPESILLTLYCNLCDPDWEGCDSDDEGGGEECPEGPADRDSREYREELVKYTFPVRDDLRRTCHWSRPTCEFQINSVYVTNPGTPAIATVQKFHTARRKNLKGDLGRYEVLDPEEIDFLKWDRDVYADPMKYNWIYSHPKTGVRQTHTIGGTFTLPNMGGNVNQQIQISYEFRDILLGEDAVYYCDEADGQGTQYSTGKLRFFIKEHED